MDMRTATLSVILFLLVTWPLIGMADRPVIVLGVPLLYLYLFTTWAIVIALFAWMARTKEQRQDRG